MRYPGIGLLLLGMAFVANATEPDGALFRNSELPTLQIVQFDSAGQERATPYRFILSVAPTPSGDATPFGSGFDSTSRLPVASERHKEISWVEKTNRAEVFGRDRASLLPLLRFESKGERLEIRPQRHALSIKWRMTFD